MFKTWLKEERQKRAMTQADFADFIGVSRPMLRAYEAGEKYPSPATIRLISGATRCSIKKITTLIKEQKNAM